MSSFETPKVQARLASPLGRSSHLHHLTHISASQVTCLLRLVTVLLDEFSRRSIYVRLELGCAIYNKPKVHTENARRHRLTPIYRRCIANTFHPTECQSLNDRKRSMMLFVRSHSHLLGHLYAPYPGYALNSPGFASKRCF